MGIRVVGPVRVEECLVSHRQLDVHDGWKYDGRSGWVTEPAGRNY